MRFRLNLVFIRRVVAISGMAGVVFFLGIFLLPVLFAASLDPGRAQEEIRRYLKRQQTLRQQAALQEAGLSSPNVQMAERWKADLNQIDQIKFVSVEVKHFLFAPPSSTRRIFLVRAVVRDEKQQEQTRYFSLSASNKFFDFFWVAERSKWMWVFAF